MIALDYQPPPVFGKVSIELGTIAELQALYLALAEGLHSRSATHETRALMTPVLAELETLVRRFPAA